MAGLQQYNFFPTDLFYPKPPSSVSVSMPTVLPLQTPVEDLPLQQQQQQQPRRLVKATPSSTSSLVHSHNKKQQQQQQQPLIVDDNKEQKGILNWVTWFDHEEDDEGLEAF